MYFIFLSFVFYYNIQLLKGSKFCEKQEECIEKVKKLAGDANLFWFGDEWRTQCDQKYFKYHGQNKFNIIDCINSPSLSKYHSLGSRLFHVPTFSSHFLSNLKIHPRITFFPKTGNYNACDHDFHVIVNKKKDIHGHPNSLPIPSYQTLTPPDINWQGLGKDGYRYIVLILDPSEGKINFLSINFPYETNNIIEYTPLKPYRHSPSPMVFLIFRQGLENGNLTYKPDEAFHDNKNSTENIFDLPKFIIKNNLTTRLVGLTWVLIKTDPFSLEYNRIYNGIDNCHSLLIKKLQKEHTFDFVSNFNLNELDSSLLVSYYQPNTEFNVCCESYAYEENEVIADPLSDGYMPSIVLINKPKLKMVRSSSFIDNYQRSLRHYVVKKDEKFILVMFEPNKKHLYWLVSDISGNSLANGDELDGHTVVPYEDPSSYDPTECNQVVVMIFEEQKIGRKINIRKNREGDNEDRTEVKFNQMVLNYFEQNGEKKSNHRLNFNIENFKAFLKLKLSSISWFESCYDEFNAVTQIRQIAKSNLTDSEIREKYGKHKINKVEYYGYPNTEEVRIAKT
uniref:Uncharacterized protein n=1 Tax=Parastrongyloides trichosuri TaxID=131310 RepID=A0A0N4Z9B0_PARTI